MSSLAHRCVKNFSSKIQSRGTRYFDEGRVEIESLSNRGVMGTVRGTGRQTYSVRVLIPEEGSETHGDVLYAACRCPYFDRGHFCKHLWAFLLEVDRSGLFAEVPGSGVLDLMDAGDPAEVFLDSEDFEGDEFERPASARTGFGVRTAQEANLAGPANAWRFLDSRSRMATSRAREFHYLVGISDGGNWSVDVYEAPLGGPEDGETIPRAEAASLLGESELSAEDAAAIRSLKGVESAVASGPYGDSSYGRGRYSSGGNGSFAFPDSLAAFVLPVLSGTGRLYRATTVRTPASIVPASCVRLRWGGDRPCTPTFRLVVGGSLKRQGGRAIAGQIPFIWQLEASLVNASDVPIYGVGDIDYIGEDGLVVVENEILRMEPSEFGPLLRRLNRDGPLEIVPDDIDDFVSFVAPLELPGLAWPARLGWSTVSVEPKGRISFLTPRRGAPKVMVWAELAFDYGNGRIADSDASRVLVDRVSRKLVRRSRDAERVLRDELDQAGLVEISRSYGDEADYQIKRSEMALAVSVLLDQGWEVEAEGIRYVRSSNSHCGISSETDWFDLSGGVEFEGEAIPLPTLLAALKRNERTIQLGDGKRGVLPIAWLRRVQSVAGFGRVSGEAIRFETSQALLLSILIDQQGEQGQVEVEVDRDAHFEKIYRELERSRRPKRVGKPKGLHAELRGYQREGLSWLYRMSEIGLGACLADDMGLGKTVQALGLLMAQVERRPEGGERLPSLVVVPTSLIHNWLAEAARFTPGLKTLEYSGPQRAMLRAGFGESDLVVTSYGILRRDIEKLCEHRFETVLLDEAQAIKNPSTRVSKAVRLLRARYRVALSGTPVENHVGELWSLFDFLNPGLLGDRRGGLRSLNDGDPETIEAAARAVGPFILRRTKEEVLKDLPPKTEQTLFCELEGKQKRYYAELRDHYRRTLLQRVDQEGLPKSKIHVLEALLRLRQAACHPGLIDAKRVGDGSAKLDLLSDRLDQAITENHKVLIFSQFTSLLSLVESQVKAKGIDFEVLDGRTRNRGARVARFQEDPSCRVFLISLKAGGHGLNLTAADYAFILDPWWNPAAEAQAIDRMHRIGQTRPVFAYRILARNTIEEQILELQERKRALADTLIGGARGGLKNLTREDLERLLQ